ncbi:MAG: AI-2E family transporter [Fusicatenibacter sp.]|nr:AI-2E family transporter [Fusicatenibacter sp.]
MSQEQNQPNQETKSARKLRGITSTVSFVVLGILVLFFYIISNLPSISSWFSWLLSILSPVIGGAAIAYFLNPVLRFIEKHLLRKIRSLYFKRMLSILLTYLFVICVIAVVCLLMIPQLVASITELISEYDNYIANAVTYINSLFNSIAAHLPFKDFNPDGEILSLDIIKTAIQKLISSSGNIMDTIINYVRSYGSKLVSGVTNLIVAIFLSFYLLASKEKRAAQINKFLTAVCTEKRKTFIYDTVTLADKTFGSFLGGKILDSLIIGIISFVIFTIFKIPYATMIATIVGVTNVIPFFGPLIGAIPSAFIIFIANPSKTLTFLILILLIQQFDGNILGPKILGNSTGVSSLCILTAITVMGSLWGVFGMIVGVPLFAIIISLVQQFLDRKLSEKGLPQDLDSYYIPNSDDEMIRPHLSPKYYLAWLQYHMYGKRKGYPAPCKEDYYVTFVRELDRDIVLESEAEPTVVSIPMGEDRISSSSPSPSDMMSSAELVSNEISLSDTTDGATHHTVEKGSEQPSAGSRTVNSSKYSNHSKKNAAKKQKKKHKRK